MTPDQCRAWFVKQRFTLHARLNRALREAPDHRARLMAMNTHDQTVIALARHTGLRIARAELVTVLARRVEQHEV